MGKKLFLAVAGISAMAFVSCAQGPNYHEQEVLRKANGVIGVFRQPAFYCSEANPHYMQLGANSVEVKPTWSDEQDNMFVTELKPGTATLYSYAYSCGGDENKFVLDTAAGAQNPGPIGVIVPESGLCKIVISFVQGDKLFDRNDALLEEIAKRDKFPINMSQIPYCEVVDNAGEKISFANRDSLLAAQYSDAIKDAADALAEEIYPLVVIDSTSDKVVWNGDKSKVLLATMNDVPDFYKDGETITLNQEVWTVSERELFDWYKSHQKGVRNWNFRFKQLLGLPKNSKHSHFSLIWVDPKDIIRPAYVTDIRSSEMKTLFEDDLDENSDSTNTEIQMWFKNWFDDTRAKSYVPKKGYPWTRLGYTYDWGSRGSKYGLTEFLVLPGAQVEVRFTKNIKSYVQWLNDRKN